MKKDIFKNILTAVSSGNTAYLKITDPGTGWRISSDADAEADNNKDSEEKSTEGKEGEQSEQFRYRKFLPQERLIVLGGGHISQPVCHIASMLGFEVTIVDDRPSFANYERFPDVSAVICEDFRTAIRQLAINENDYVCVVTRGHQWDGECLREILSGVHPSYLGMIGSRRRVKSLYQVLESEGFDRSVLETIHSPIGIPIKAVTPAEIAVSICAELVEHKRSNASGDKENTLYQTNVDKELLHFTVDDPEPKAAMIVLGTKGSTPAPEGALMVIDSHGASRGTIGGGCSEAEVITIAREIARNGGSQTAFIDMTNEAAQEEGMACGGTMEVLIEAVTD